MSTLKELVAASTSASDSDSDGGRGRSPRPTWSPLRFDALLATRIRVTTIARKRKNGLRPRDHGGGGNGGGGDCDAAREKKSRTNFPLLHGVFELFLG